ncbi:hypothetical protein OG21DRAFT_1425432, partial [Imleria badia]
QTQKLGYKIIHATTILLPAWREIFEKLKLKLTYLLQDVATRWNSTFNMLDYALQHLDTVDGITQKQELGLRKFELSDEEWTVVEQLHMVLKDATLFFSRATPNLATVILAMDHINHQLQMFAQDQKYLPSIHAAVSLARKTLNRYYLLTDNSEVYRIVMSEHLSSIF